MATTNKRAYSWSLIIYEEKERIYNSIVFKTDLISKWAISPLHDNDLKKDNTLKEKHYHVLLVFNFNISLKNLISKVFPDYESNILGEPINDKYSSFCYLSHSGFNDKYQYDANKIMTNSLSYWESARDNKSNNNYWLELIDDINSNMKYRDLVLKYGRDIIFHYKDLLRFSVLIGREDDEINRNRLTDFKEVDYDLTNNF